LLQAFNNVQNSKLKVTSARAKLLPSINLGVLLPALTNPTFLLGSVKILFPFLIPSNWAVLKQEKKLFESDKASYKALQLNVLSLSLSLYYTYLTDQKIQNVFKKQSELLNKMYLMLKRQSQILGNIAIEDLEMSFAELQESKMRDSQLEILLMEEKAALRSMLGLSLETDLQFEIVSLNPSSFEGKLPLEIANHSLLVAPEMEQLKFLIAASKADKFAKMFGFISTASIGGNSKDNTSAFDNMKAGGDFTFGGELFVNIKMSNNNTSALYLREEQLKQENERVAEIIVGKMYQLNEQKLLAKSILDNRRKVYQGQKRQYDLGLISLQTLLQTESQLTDSEINYYKTEQDFTMTRLTLQRLVIDGDFSKIQGCLGENWSKKRGLFHPKKKRQSLDQLCYFKK